MSDLLTEVYAEAAERYNLETAQLASVANARAMTEQIRLGRANQGKKFKPAKQDDLFAPLPAQGGLF